MASAHLPPSRLERAMSSKGKTTRRKASAVIWASLAGFGVGGVGAGGFASAVAFSSGFGAEGVGASTGGLAAATSGVAENKTVLGDRDSRYACLGGAAGLSKSRS